MLRHVLGRISPLGVDDGQVLVEFSEKSKAFGQQIQMYVDPKQVITLKVRKGICGQMVGYNL